VQVLFAVRGEHGVSLDNGAVVYPALGNRTGPHGLSGLDLHSVHGPVSSADHHQSHPVNGRDYRSRVDRIVRTPAGRACPYALPGPLVESIKAMAALSGITPAVDDRTDDDQIAFDHRRGCPTPMRSPRAEFVSKRSTPQYLAVAAERG